MSFQRRKVLIAKLEKEFDAKVITVVTGDRQGMETRIAPDILPLVSEHLSRMNGTKKIALYLYTPGGDTISGWGLVNLIRQYCDELLVLIPFRALSCGTLIALGAEKIVMGRHGLISPIDPSVASPFNPTVQRVDGQGQIVLPVSVEDMVGFLDLARKELELKSNESLVQILRVLAEKVHPLALGAVYRAREQNCSLATRLLSMHNKNENSVKKIVNLLTQELPTHSYLIGRREAIEDIGLDITIPSDKAEKLMWDLYKEYENWLRLTSPVSAELDLGDNDRKTVRYERAAVESIQSKTLVQHIFTTDKILIRMSVTHPGAQGPVDQIMERAVFQGWVLAENGEELKCKN